MFVFINSTNCQTKTNTKMESKESNPLLCDIETGMCEMQSGKENV